MVMASDTVTIHNTYGQHSFHLHYFPHCKIVAETKTQLISLDLCDAFCISPSTIHIRSPPS